MKPVNAVAIVDKSVLSDRDVALMVEGYRGEMAAICEAWALPVPGLAYYPPSYKGSYEEQAAVFLVDSANEPDAFGYHTALGIARWAYVDVGICNAYGEPVSRVFGHELYELVVDPDLDRWVGPLQDGSHVAVEVCDPVQRDGYTIEAEFMGSRGRVDIADWVTPAWFQPGAPGPYSHLSGPQRPLENAPGGYHLVDRGGNVISVGAAKLKSWGRTVRRVQPRPRP